MAELRPAGKRQADLEIAGVVMPDNKEQNALDLLSDLVAKAKKAGADAADAVAQPNEEDTTSCCSNQEGCQRY